MSARIISTLNGSGAGDAPPLRPLEPSVRGVPLLGSLVPLARDALGFLQATDREHGPVSVFRVGPKPWVLVSSAETVEETLVDRGADFDKCDAIQRHGRMVFGNGLPGLKGAAWRRRRSVVAPAFHRAPLEDEAIVRLVGEWAEQRSRHAAFPLHRELSLVMTRVLCSSLLRGGDDERAVDAATRIFEGIETRLRIGVPLPDWLPLPPVSKMRRGLADLVGCVDGAQTATGAKGASPDLREILFSLRGDTGERLLEDHLIRMEVGVMVGVGGRQLAFVLAWALYLLGGHPEVLGSLCDQIDGVLGGRDPELGDLDALPLATQAIEETLRLYPSLYILFREALRDTSVGGMRVPRGTVVVLSPWVTQRLPTYFERPDDFIPERWTVEFRRALPRAAYFPFGAGSRTCIAQVFARKQLALALVAMLARHRVQLDRTQGVKPRAGLLMEMPADVLARVDAR